MIWMITAVAAAMRMAGRAGHAAVSAGLAAML